MIEFGETNHIPTEAATVAVEKIFVWVNQKAWIVVAMQRTQSQHRPRPSGRAALPIVRLQITQQRNLLLQFIDSLAIHGLLASIGRIRQIARIPGNDGGRSQKVWVDGSCLHPAAAR